MPECGSDQEPDASSPVAAPEQPAVIDVHPPHHAVSSWRDFAIHIVTITIGLLIAIALEQTVEYVHHRHQVAEMEQSLRGEGREMQAVATADTRVIDAAVAGADSAIAWLQAPNAEGRSAPAPQEIDLVPPGSSAWSAARDSGLLTLAPRSLVDNYWKVYFVQDAAVQQIRAVYAQLDMLQALASIHPTGTPLAPTDRQAMLIGYADYREKLNVLKIDLRLLDKAAGLALRGRAIDGSSLRPD